jgi:hypothetical protein
MIKWLNFELLVASDKLLDLFHGNMLKQYIDKGTHVFHIMKRSPTMDIVRHNITEVN